MKKQLLVFITVLLFCNLAVQKVSAAELNLQNDIYVASTEALCFGRSNCFFNDTSDQQESNALTKAIKHARDNNLSNPSIYILSPYEINSHTIVVDYPVTLIGQNGGWISTSNSDCSRPMFSITTNATIRDIYLNDGACSSPSRDLLAVNAAATVLVEHSTFENGQTAISYQGGSGLLTLRFNHINNNQIGINNLNSDANAQLLAVANNIISNGTQQVSCSGSSSLDHNFWGDGVLPSQSAPGCGTDDAKRLDALIVRETTGVAARLLTLSGSLSQDFYGFRASSPDSASLFVVNHGGSRPFLGSAGSVYQCSNYYDVFLPQSSSPSSITLSFAYRDTFDCAQIIQSAAFCGSGNPAKFPLLWYDPKTRVTDRWDKTGDKPQSSVGSIYAGQETTCRTSSKTIEVIVDNNGRPDLLNDLFFTPFVIGYEQAGVLSFTATSTTNAINLDWTTVTEVNTLSYYITRSISSGGVFNKISGDFSATGTPTTSTSYTFSDSSAIPGQTYYYKLVAVNTDGTTQQTIGPVTGSLQSVSTPTRTPTRTVTPSLTPIYRSPTPFQTATSAFLTPGTGDPTLFIPTDTETAEFEPTPDQSLTPEDTPTQTSTPSRTPSPTVSGTPLSGLLGKTDRYSSQKQLTFILGGAAVLLIAILAFYFHKKH